LRGQEQVSVRLMAAFPVSPQAPRAALLFAAVRSDSRAQEQVSVRLMAARRALPQVVRAASFFSAVHSKLPGEEPGGSVPVQNDSVAGSAASVAPQEQVELE
jgi:hypothetical protein